MRLAGQEECEREFGGEARYDTACRIHNGPAAKIISCETRLSKPDLLANSCRSQSPNICRPSKPKRIHEPGKKGGLHCRDTHALLFKLAGLERGW